MKDVRDLPLDGNRNKSFEAFNVLKDLQHLRFVDRPLHGDLRLLHMLAPFGMMFFLFSSSSFISHQDSSRL